MWWAHGQHTTQHIQLNRNKSIFIYKAVFAHNIRTLSGLSYVSSHKIWNISDGYKARYYKENKSSYPAQQLSYSLRDLEILWEMAIWEPVSKEKRAPSQRIGFTKNGSLTLALRASSRTRPPASWWSHHFYPICNYYICFSCILEVWHFLIH